MRWFQCLKNKPYPYLRKKQPEIILFRMVKICGIGENQVAEEIQDLIEKQTNPTVRLMQRQERYILNYCKRKQKMRKMPRNDQADRP